MEPFWTEPSSHTYHHTWYFKHPYFTWLHVSRERNIWKTYQVNTLVIYSVLATVERIGNGECKTFACTTWFNIVWMQPTLVKINQYQLVWDIWNENKVFVHCKFCDPCRPYMLLEYAKLVFKDGHWMPKLKEMVEKSRLRDRITIDTITFKKVPQALLKPTTVRGNEKLANYFKGVFLFDLSLLPFLNHPLIIYSLLQSNVSTQFSY